MYCRLTFIASQVVFLLPVARASAAAPPPPPPPPRAAKMQIAETRNKSGNGLRSRGEKASAHMRSRAWQIPFPQTRHLHCNLRHHRGKIYGRGRNRRILHLVPGQALAHPILRELKGSF